MITVTVGKMPGRAVDVSVDSDVLTVATAIDKAGFDVGGQNYELRVNNLQTTDFNYQLQNGDIVTLTQSIKGNAMARINLKVDDSDSGVYLVEPNSSCKELIELAGSDIAEEDVKSIVVNGKPKKDMPVLHNDDTVIISTKELMNVSVKINRGKLIHLQLEQKARITALLETLQELGKLDYEHLTFKQLDIRKDDKKIKFAFAQLKDGDKISISAPEVETETKVETSAEPTITEPVIEEYSTPEGDTVWVTNDEACCCETEESCGCASCEPNVISVPLNDKITATIVISADGDKKTVSITF